MDIDIRCIISGIAFFASIVIVILYDGYLSRMADEQASEKEREARK